MMRGSRWVPWMAVGLWFTSGLSMAVAYGIGIRHLVWSQMAGHHPMASLFWMIQAEGVVTAVFWWRVVRSLWRRRRSRIQLARQVMPLLRRLDVESLHPGLSSHIQWYLSPDMERYAFSWGWRSPRAVISRGLWMALTKDERAAVLFHEQHHLFVHDPLWQELLSVVVDTLPLKSFRNLFRSYLKDREIRADWAAVKAFGGQREPLAAAMWAVVQDVGRVPAYANVSKWAGSLDARIDYLVSGHTPSGVGANWAGLASPSLLPIFLAVGQGLLLWCR